MKVMMIIAGIVVICLVLGFVLRSRWERRQIKTEYYFIRKKNSNNINEGGSGMRLAFISDVHDYYQFDGIRKIMEVLSENKPDLVLLGGDIFTVKGESNKIPDTENALKLAGTLAKEFTVIYAPGNHEHRFQELYPDEFIKFRNHLEQENVLFLQDGTLNLQNCTISAVDLEMEYYKKFLPRIGGKKEMPEKYLISKLGLTDTQHFHVLLMHSPLYLEEAERWGADLVLSGHFHGGTIRLTEHVGLMTPQFQFFDNRCAGLLKYKDASMIVSRGLGTHTFNIRWNDLPEISIVDINT